ncbi:MAG: hypothetical protein C0518_05060 [Opitutus sp.]|nr:hypothetical protein [Opitutus sp.]
MRNRARRPLTAAEEQRLLAVARQHPSTRDRALVLTQLYTGFRIAEVLSLRVGSVRRNGRLLPRIGVKPRFLKGKRGCTRWVPVTSELHATLELHLQRMEADSQAAGLGALSDDCPLFLRVPLGEGAPESLSTGAARKIFARLFAQARCRNDGRLGTHTLRKTFARKVHELSGHDIHVTCAALGHSSIAVTERYLEADAREVARLIRKADWTRRPRHAA